MLYDLLLQSDLLLIIFSISRIADNHAEVQVIRSLFLMHRRNSTIIYPWRRYDVFETVIHVSELAMNINKDSVPLVYEAMIRKSCSWKQYIYIKYI